MASHPGTRPLNLYVATVTAAGAAAVAAAVWLARSGPVGPEPSLFWLFVALFTIAEALPLAWLRRDGGGEVTASWTFAIALLYVAPPAGALLGVAAACLLSDALRRKPLVRTLFNAANYSLSLGMGAVILTLTGTRTALLTDHPGLWWFVVFLVTASAVVVLNNVLTSAVLAMAQNLPTWPMVRGGVSFNLATDAMLLALAPVLVVVAQKSLTFVPLLCLTMYAVYRSVQLALDRQHEATHDGLTRLPNRRFFVKQVSDALRAANRRHQSLAIVLLDLDDFKAVNDHLGDHVGDLCLQEVAQRLRAAQRPSDLVARIGGDDFAVLVSGFERAEPATTMAGRLLDALRRPCVVAGVPVAVRGSFGIAMYPDHGHDVGTLLRNADHAMYMAKRSLARIAVYEPSQDGRRHNSWDLLSELPAAMENGQLVLHFQPKLDMTSGRLAGCEALVRWDHPTLGLVPPSDFMSSAESTELIKPLTEHILRMALAQCVSWRHQGLRVDVSVNASTRNLDDLRFPATVAGLLAEAGLEPSALELEITENTVECDSARSTTVLRALREGGVRIAIDDFGTGYSSLAHLRELSIDSVKLDRSFITGIASNPHDLAIVGAVISLARDLGLDTVAEGIETVACWDQLADLGCRYGQGYLMCRPIPASEVTSWALALPGGRWRPTGSRLPS